MSTLSKKQELAELTIPQLQNAIKEFDSNVTFFEDALANDLLTAGQYLKLKSSVRINKYFAAYALKLLAERQAQERATQLQIQF